MDSRRLSDCPNCGHDWHTSGAAGSCAVMWMGERCNCRRMTRPDPHAYTADLAEIRAVAREAALEAIVAALRDRSARRALPPTRRASASPVH